MLSKNAKTLIALLLVLAASVVYRATTREEPKRVKELTYKPGGKGTKPEVGREGVTPPEKKAENAGGGSKEEKRGYSGVIKNPFRPLFPPPPPPVIKLPPPPPPVPFPVITTKGPSPAQIESGKIKFVGLLQKEGEKKVFLSKDKEVFIVKKGDSVGSFQVADITDTQVTLVARNTKEEFKITIEDVKPTKPGILPGGGRR